MDVVATNGIVAVQFAMTFRCNRVRTDPKFLYQWHLSRARGS